MRRSVSIAVTALALVATGCAGRKDGGNPVSLASCLEEMTDPATFARTPAGHAGMVSTYDRTGGNEDGGLWSLAGRKASPDGLYKVASLTGPGCVTRIWHASVPAEEWLFYFDGEKEPRIRASRREPFGSERFPSPLCGWVSGGSYFYMPLPYSKSLRIMIKAPKLGPSSKAYCHVNYVTYPKGTAVRSFPAEYGPDERERIDQVCEQWREKEAALREIITSIPSLQTLPVAPGQSATLLEHEGEGVLRGFTLRLTPPPSTTALGRERMLRALVLRMTWDGAGEPSVDVPLGDFFGNAFHSRRYSSAMFGKVDDVYVCRWPMGFARSARVELRNDGSQPVEIAIGSRVSPGRAGTGYFHARWSSAVSRGGSFNLLRAKGAGHYVGCYLSSIGMDGTWNILEGDEAIRVDGEEVPSLHGTGLEDYFNGAWYYTGIFDLPLHGLVEKAPIRTDQYRLHLLDRVPFRDGLTFNFEFGHGNAARGYMSGVAYWYQSTPMPAGNEVAALAKRYPQPDPLAPVGIMGQLFELERIGQLEEARERCLAFVEEFSDIPATEIIDLRALAYVEAMDGINAVRGEYQRVATSLPDQPAGVQAQSLLWFHEDPARALLGHQVNGKFKLFLDGKLLAQGGHPLHLQVVRLTIAPGHHELAAEVVPNAFDGWFSVYLRSHTTNVVSDGTWERSLTKPADWPATTSPDVVWEAGPNLRGADMLPRMNFWQLTPNAYVNMQSAQQLYRPDRDLPKAQGPRTFYLRRQFVVK